MKRSEMLQLIKLEMRTELRNEGVKEPQISNILLDGPERILRTMEQKGMLPPDNGRGFFVNVNYGTKDANYQERKPLHEWDEEI